MTYPVLKVPLNPNQPTIRVWKVLNDSEWRDVSVLVVMICVSWWPLTSSRTTVRMSWFPPPFPQIDFMGSMVIVWRVRGKIISSVLCNFVHNNCAQCSAHTWTNLTVPWIGFCLTGLFHCVLGFIFVYVLLHACVGL